MTTLLNLIWCWLNEWTAIFNDYFVSAYDQFLLVVDGMLVAAQTSPIQVSAIDPNYTWLLGATGVSQSLAILGGALLTRFLLQSIPFVRWGA